MAKRTDTEGLGSEPEIYGDAGTATATAAPAQQAAKLPRFRVEYGDLCETIEAPNARDAWAFFCDKNKKWPSPKQGKVTKVES